MVSTVQNSDVTQKDADLSVVVAVTSHAVFESETGDTSSTQPYGRGVAFPFIQALQKVNERLLEKNPHETLLFDVILLSKDGEEHHSRIQASTKHYGLEIGRFCFCSEEDSMESLLSNNVKLFLSTDSSDVSKALQRGVASALLCCQTANHSSEQLRVLFSGDDGDFRDDFSESQVHQLKDAKGCIKEFASLMGEMRSRFGMEDSPLSTSLLTVYGSRDTCARALKTLRAWGLSVDEAYCLAGAPRGPIVSLVRPHVIFTDGMYSIQD
ncbi:cytosolic 5'-nucleotidase 1A [Polymixia lowei]